MTPLCDYSLTNAKSLILLSVTAELIELVQYLSLLTKYGECNVNGGFPMKPPWRKYPLKKKYEQAG